MEKIIVKGGQRLAGRVRVEGAKNAVLPIQAAAILASSGSIQLSNVPILSDVTTMNQLLRFLNIKVNFDEENHLLALDASNPVSSEAPLEYVSRMRASMVVLGPLLARTGHAQIALPGGCAIGSRPIDLHLKGLRQLGAVIEQHDGYLEAHAEHLIGDHIYLDFPSVGATQNIMMAATLAQGITTIENAASEPEIVDLANMLNKMGARVHGAGTEVIRIQGVNFLHGCEHYVMPDRIEAGTFMIAAAVTNGDVIVEGAIAEHNSSLIAKLEERGVKFVPKELRDGQLVTTHDRNRRKHYKHRQNELDPSMKGYVKKTKKKVKPGYKKRIKKAIKEDEQQKRKLEVRHKIRKAKRARQRQHRRERNSR